MLTPSTTARTPLQPCAQRPPADPEGGNSIETVRRPADTTAGASAGNRPPIPGAPAVPSDPGDEGTAGTPDAGHGFGWLLSANAISYLGDGLLVVALPLIAASVTDDARLVTLVYALLRLPWIIAPILGAWTDRHRRPRAVMMGADFVRAVMLLVLAAAIAAGQPLIAIYVTAIVLGVGDIVFSSAAFTYVRHLLPPERLTVANSRIGVAQTWGEQVVGPVAGGAVFGLGRFVPVVGDALTFAVSGLLLGRVPQVVVERADVADRPSLLADARAGWRVLRSDARLWRLVVWIAVLAFGATMQVSAIVLIAKDQLSLDAKWIGVFSALIACGNVLGAAIAPRILERLDDYSALVCCSAAIMTCNGLAATSRSTILVTIALMIDGIAVMVANVCTRSVRQRLAPPTMIGRVMSTSRMLTIGVQVLGALVGGWIISRHGTQAALATASAIMAGLLVLGVRWLRSGMRGGPPAVAHG
jgi:MFS family permease